MKRKLVQLFSVPGQAEIIRREQQQYYQKVLFISRDRIEEIENYLTVCVFSNYHQFEELLPNILYLEQNIPIHVIGYGLNDQAPQLSDSQQQELMNHNVILMDELRFSFLQDEDPDDSIDLTELNDYEHKQKCCNIF